MIMASCFINLCDRVHFVWYFQVPNVAPMSLWYLNSAWRHYCYRFQGYELSFGGFTDRWHGSPSTVTIQEGASVWGAVWELDIKHQNTLDR